MPPLSWWARKRRSYRTALRHLGIDRYWLLNKVARKEGTVPHLVGILMLYMAIALLFPLAVAVIYGEDQRIWLFPFVLTLIVGGSLLLRFRPPEVTRPSEALFVG